MFCHDLLNKEIYVSQALVEENTEIQGNENQLISQGSSHSVLCYISYSKDEQISSKFFKESFLLYKLYKYFPPSDIPSNGENNKFN